MIVGLISFQVVSLAVVALSAAARRPRPFGVEILGTWGGAMPSRPVAWFSAILVTMLYSLVPKGRWRQAGKWVATGLVTLLALDRMYLGVDTPSDVLVGAAIGVTIPLLLPLVHPQRGVPGQLPPGPHRPPGRRRGQGRGHPARPPDQLGLEIEEVKPFGLAGSAGSTPLRIKVGATRRRSCSASCTPAATCARTGGTSWAASCCTAGWRTRSRSTPSGGWSSRRTTPCTSSTWPACRARDPTASSSSPPTASTCWSPSSSTAPPSSARPRSRSTRA